MIYVFVIRKDGFHMAVRERPSNLDSPTQDLQRSLKTMDGNAYVRSARELYSLLIHPIAGLLSQQRHLVIVPDGNLHYVPFEVFLGPENSHGGFAPDFRSLPYLLNAFEISYALSGTVFLETRRESGKSTVASRSFAGFAPVFRDSAPGRRDPGSGFLNKVELAPLRSVTIEGRQFRELPYSEAEVKTIVRAFTARGGAAWSGVNESASEKNFKANAGKYTILHIATHGYIDENQSSLSAPLFSPSREPSSGEDGILYAGETYSLQRNADLVVLSSCEGGVGRLVRGEGLMAMTRGFLYARARNIMYSLWKVQDKHASRLMASFYSRVLEGETFSSALREAKLEMIKDAASANPFKWAGVALMGE